MATYSPPPTPSETRIVIEMTENEARKLLEKSPNFRAHLEVTISKALASPAVPARAAREPDDVTTHNYAGRPGTFKVAHFGSIICRDDLNDIDLSGLHYVEWVRPVSEVRKIAHDMLAACDWAERQAAQRAAESAASDLLSEAVRIANGRPPEPDPRSPIPGP